VREGLSARIDTASIVHTFGLGPDGRIVISVFGENRLFEIDGHKRRD